jgi:hypothetical protein
LLDEASNMKILFGDRVGSVQHQESDIRPFDGFKAAVYTETVNSGAYPTAFFYAGSVN